MKLYIKAMIALSLPYIALFALLISPAWADDAVVALAPNEMLFEKSKDLIMQDETLTITKTGKSFTDQAYSVDVDFHIKNTSPEDVNRKIAFALPPVRCDMETNALWEGLNTKDPYEKGLKDFSVVVDGKPVAYTTRIVAMMGDLDITQLLNKNGIPLNPCEIKQDAEGHYDSRYSEILKENNLLTDDNTLAFRENIYFEWDQIFPAGQVLNIHHHYTPVVGAAVPASRTITDLNSPYIDAIPANYLWSRNLATLAETDPTIVDKRPELDPNNHDLRFCLSPSWVLYHLTTGAYWNGGIGVFKLVLKDNTGAPFAVNEFFNSGDPVQTYIAGNSMTLTLNNFIPTKDLLVLFLSLPQSAQDLKTCGM